MGGKAARERLERIERIARERIEALGWKPTEAILALVMLEVDTELKEAPDGEGVE